MEQLSSLLIQSLEPLILQRIAHALHHASRQSPAAIAVQIRHRRQTHRHRHARRHAERQHASPRLLLLLDFLAERRLQQQTRQFRVLLKHCRQSAHHSCQKIPTSPSDRTESRSPRAKLPPTQANETPTRASSRRRPAHRKLVRTEYLVRSRGRRANRGKSPADPPSTNQISAPKFGGKLHIGSFIHGYVSRAPPAPMTRCAPPTLPRECSCWPEYPRQEPSDPRYFWGWAGNR